MSVKLISAVMDRPDLDPHEKLVMICLADHANDEGICYPSVSRLQLRTSMSERGIQNVIRRLQARGFLVIDTQKGRRGANLYTVVVDPPEAAPTPAPAAPPHRVHPAPDAPHPRTGCTPTPAPGAPEPSFNHQEPCARRAARRRERPREAQPSSQRPPADGQHELLAKIAERLERGAYVAPSQLRPDQARTMLSLGMVGAEHLRRAGIAF